MKVDVMDKSGKKVSDATLEKEVFGRKVNQDLMAQYVHIFRTNQRQGTTAAKTRAEVSGGGRKPWRQKGTGRARHGSTRSPLWVHGGTSHGPKPKSWQLSMPSRMKRATILSALSEKYSGGNVYVVDEINFEKPNTKQMQEILKKLKLEGKTLIILSKSEPNILKSVSNIKEVVCSLAQNVNTYDLISNQNVLFTKDSLNSLQERFK